MDDDLRDLDAEQLLAASSAAVRERRAAEVRDLEVLAQWAAVHSADPTDGPNGRLARTVGNVLVPTGGEGTPGVQDFSLGEIALARGTGVTATANALADVMDLMHRLPLTWAVCKRAEAEIFVARGSRSCPATCRWTASVWWTPPSRGSSRGSPVGGCWPSRRPRSSRPTPLHQQRWERGAATPLREPVAHRRGRAAHGHRPGRGRRRGVGGRDGGAGGRDHRPAAPRPERRRDPLRCLLHAGPTGRAARPAA